MTSVPPRGDGAFRTECVKCGLFAGWTRRAAPAPAIPAAGPPPPPPEDWLYASRKLELLTLPADPLLGPVLVLGDVTYYRCTPAVLRWLLAAGQALDARLRRQVAAGEIDIPESGLQCRTYLAGVEAVRAFVERAFGREHVGAELAKAGTPQLPDVGRVPD